MTTVMTMPGTQLVLYFTGSKEVELWQTEFTHPTWLGPGGKRRTARGKDEGAHPGCGSFQWTAAVRVLSSHLLRYAAWGRRRRDGNEPPVLEGGRCTPAATLNYALSKKPQWVCDMFGIDEAGNPFLLHLIKRSNADLKRKGEPVRICLDVAQLPPDMVKVVLRNGEDDCGVDDPKMMEDLAEVIEASSPPKATGDPANTAVLTIKGNLPTDWPEKEAEIKRWFADRRLPCDIIRVEEGSIKVTLRMSLQEAEQLYWAVHSGEMEDLEVLDFAYLEPAAEPSAQQPWNPVPAPQERRTCSPAVTWNKCSLLVLDDEPYIVATLAPLLSEHYEVLTADSPEAAQALFAQRSIDLILTDQRMPRMSGVQLLEWVREHHPRTVRLLMTGFAELEEAVEAINRAQVFRYLFKPWRTEELQEVLASAARTFLLERDNEKLVQELKTLNQELEQRVQQRTRELEEANFDLEQKNKMLEKLALTDPLTGLANRRSMDRLAERELRRRDRYPSPLALAIIDVDDFKEINSRHLLPGGDKVLVDLARCLMSSLRTVDSLGRIGGEEFLVIAPETSLKGAIVLGERIRTTVENTVFSYKGHVIPVTVSLGFAVADANVIADYEQMKHFAAAALAEAKVKGRNRVIPHQLQIMVDKARPPTQRSDDEAKHCG